MEDVVQSERYNLYLLLDSRVVFCSFVITSFSAIFLLRKSQHGKIDLDDVTIMKTVRCFETRIRLYIAKTEEKM